MAIGCLRSVENPGVNVKGFLVLFAAASSGPEVSATVVEPRGACTIAKIYNFIRHASQTWVINRK